MATCKKVQDLNKDSVVFDHGRRLFAETENEGELGLHDGSNFSC